MGKVMKSSTLEYWFGKIKKLDSNAEKLLKNFLNEPEYKPLSELTKKNYAIALYNLLKYTHKKLEKISLGDVKKYFSIRMEEGTNISTLRREYNQLRKFLRYIGIEMDFELGRRKKKEKFVVDPKNFLTNEELEKLLSILNHPRDKALIMLLRETGIRIGEALALDVRDVEFTERYGRLHIRSSKTAERYVEFVLSIPYVKAWLSVHPDPRPNSPLFVTLRGKVRRLDYYGVRSILRRALKKAGIEKRVHPHLFRHQVATELLSLERLPEEAVRIYLGWKRGSQMTGLYSSVTSEKANELVMRARYGLKTREEKREEEKGYKECPRCSRMVPIDAKYCLYCGLVLERKELVKEKEIAEVTSELIELLRDKLVELLKDRPELLEQLRELIRKS